MSENALVSDSEMFKIHTLSLEDIMKHERARYGVTQKIKDAMDMMVEGNYIDVPKDRIKETTVRQTVSTYNSKQKTFSGKDAPYFSTQRMQDATRVIRIR
jgi:hypothetical protein